MDTVNHLTKEQAKAVASQARVFMLLAPAGSGKTRVLINRIIKILEDSPRESFRILAVTYTSKAAEELNERITNAVGDQSWRVEASTIHSFALGWLRSFGGPVGVGNDVVVYSDNTDRFVTLQRYLDTLGEPTLDSNDMKEIFDKFDTLRINDQPLDTLSDSPAFGTNTSLREMYDAYLTSLREAGGIDFPGILYQFLELLKLDPSLVEHLQRVYKHVLVDECQDLTKVQSKILKKMVGNKLYLFTVGDERQSINSWAGGEIENAYYLVGTNATRENLLHNFRCAKQILSLANRVANHFSNPKNGTITPENTPLGYFDYKSAKTEGDEAKIVTTWIQELLDNGLDKNIIIPGEMTEIQPNEIGVISRAQHALYGIHSRLKQLEIPFSVLTDTDRMLITPEARLLLNLIGIQNNYKNEPAVRKASEELDNLGEFHISTYREVQQSAAKLFPQIVMIAQSKDFEQFITSLEKISIDNEGWGDDVQQISKWWEGYRYATRAHSRSFQGLMNYIFRAQRTSPTDRGVRLLTSHKAKGLEFRAVAVIGLNQGSFPDYRNLELPKLDEERRAFYVSITRASRTLLLTRPQVRTYRSGETRVQKPSQFLEEAGIPGIL